MVYAPSLQRPSIYIPTERHTPHKPILDKSVVEFLDKANNVASDVINNKGVHAIIDKAAGSPIKKKWIDLFWQIADHCSGENMVAKVLAIGAFGTLGMITMFFIREQYDGRNEAKKKLEDLKEWRDVRMVNFKENKDNDHFTAITTIINKQIKIFENVSESMKRVMMIKVAMIISALIGGIGVWCASEALRLISTVSLVILTSFVILKRGYDTLDKKPNSDAKIIEILVKDLKSARKVDDPVNLLHTTYIGLEEDKKKKLSSSE